MKIHLKYDVHVLIYYMVVKIKTGKIYGLQPPLVATPSPNLLKQ